MESDVLLKADLPLPLFVRGKVRDTYDLGDVLLIIATDRISAFDVVLPCGIPRKGIVLNKLSEFWFEQTRKMIPNHLIASVEDVSQIEECVSPKKRFKCPPYLVGRSMLVKKVARINIECVVRGYLAGSAWEEYKKTGSVCGYQLPRGLQESQELPEPLFTPTTKAEKGHDRPLTLEEMKEVVDATLAEEMKIASINIYKFAREYARSRGIIIADTKMEFGLSGNKLILIDELLTPDSSRFWDINQYKPGQSQPSFDKQPVRDWLVASGWNKEPPAPMLPPEVIERTSRIYQEAYERLTGKQLQVAVNRQ
ncbi:MAG: phosphoribosylaminoimidazolesuccinocarboxamide synthase [Dehalococcoidales bacterium]|jgi:phosphoribosylaminoimidazole-succinocarboxamide synthase|nr:phosphoribosylaminoimidazolesuccinocarboxamide synthase [Dehalococcoidales bacterium]